MVGCHCARSQIQKTVQVLLAWWPRGGDWLPEKFRLSDLSVKPATRAGSKVACRELVSETGLPLPGDADGVPREVEPGTRLAPAQLEDVALRAVSVPTANDLDFYILFLMPVEALAGLTPVTPEQLSAALNLHRSQLSVWLKRALEEGRPVQTEQAAAVCLDEAAGNSAIAFQYGNVVAAECVTMTCWSRRAYFTRLRLTSGASNRQ